MGVYGCIGGLEGVNSEGLKVCAGVGGTGVRKSIFVCMYVCIYVYVCVKRDVGLEWLI